MHYFGSFLYCKLCFRSPSICFQGAKYWINRKHVVYLHSVAYLLSAVYLHCRRFYNSMGLVPKFRNSKKMKEEIRKQNIWLKAEMTDYLCFSPRRILRRFIDLWLALVTSVSTFPIWYQWHNYSSNMTRIIRALFWPGKTSNPPQGLLTCASRFLFRTRFLWRQISYEMVSNAHVHQVTVSL